MNSTPSLPTYNRFDVLAIHECNETIETVEEAVQNSEPPPLVPTPRLRDTHPKWERRLPPKYVIAATEESRTSLKLKVELETTDTGGSQIRQLLSGQRCDRRTH